MQVAFTDHAWEEYLYWQEQDADVLEKINELIKEIKRTPFKGKGKPEPLKGNLAGYWSRRITGEHRLVYRVQGAGEDQVLRIVQARFHY
ncbi:Txe/YoeB family addiction module toxin [Algoriphagus sp.]|jgi:toxin YoeB|uniref:Txe/YoeB family addiction module toxin n=1 Tax=Algoriphagus sp. TaxID=1872435 RepID=UPI0027212106|nr:Txe/YoeB family addiction module toxin [Algoriphagus sp.]MDO8965779.1 Txe/YoeB family addiction module toxin [Algoriphagus sp.]MDP3198874.1 Txe/YoeB family addiction module toxin [Algoriphagus sp.]